MQLKLEAQHMQLPSSTRDLIILYVCLTTLGWPDVMTRRAFYYIHFLFCCFIYQTEYFCFIQLLPIECEEKS